MAILETPRLILRPLRLEDAPAIQEHFPHWEIVQHLSTKIPWPYPSNGAEEFVKCTLENVATTGNRFWAITEKGDDALIGAISYLEGDGIPGSNRGFWLGLPWQGKGYMTEAATAFNDFVFDVLGCERLLFINSVLNPSSARIKEKTGARLLGIVQFEHLNGHPDSQQWELKAEDWKAWKERSSSDSERPIHSS